MSISFSNACEQRTTVKGSSLRFHDVGMGPPIVLLHGLFGSPANWQPIMCSLADRYRFLALQLPIEPGPDRRHETFESLSQLTDHVVDFFDELGLERAVLCGNSLGGQVSLDFCLRHRERVERLVLCGSAGLFEHNLSGRIPRVCRDFIREQACKIFYDPVHVSDDLVEDVYTMLSERDYRRFLLRVAKATRDRYMLDELPQVQVPTLIVWGSEDSITPPFVAEQFRSHIQNAELTYIDRCGHAPPIEQPEMFSRLLHAFLEDMTSDPACVPRKPR